MMYASMVGPGRGNVGRLAEWRRDGDTFTAKIAIGPLRSGEYRIHSLRFVGTDGREYWVTNGAGSPVTRDASYDCAKNQWQESPGLGVDAFSCYSWDLVGNGFEVVEADTPFVELVSVAFTPTRTHPGGNVTVEVTVVGDTVESIVEVQLQSSGGDSMVAWGSEFTGGGPVFTGPLRTPERASVGEYRVSLVVVGTEVGTVVFVGGSEGSDVSCADGFQARIGNDEGAQIGRCRSEVLTATPPLILAWSSDAGSTTSSSVPEVDAGSSPVTVADSAYQTTPPGTEIAAPIAANPEPNPPETVVTMILVGIIVFLVGVVLVLVWRLRRASG
jgi:hypothetical protein